MLRHTLLFYIMKFEKVKLLFFEFPRFLTTKQVQLAS